MNSKPSESKTRLYKIRKWLLKPFWKLCKLLPIPEYRPEKYWQQRHAMYGFDLRGVGNRTLSHDENSKVYSEAGRIFLDLCAQEKIDLKTLNMLDIGCGTGFYANIFQDSGGKKYSGIDITEQLFPKLKEKFRGFKFQKLDVAKKEIDGFFDLIIMIDVTQHIVDDRRFSFAMQNIRSHLSENGLFIVTSWCSNKPTQRTPYELARPLSYYKSGFPDFIFSEPVPFRDKFIFSIRRNTRPAAGT